MYMDSTYHAAPVPSSCHMEGKHLVRSCKWICCGPHCEAAAGTTQDLKRCDLLGKVAKAVRVAAVSLCRACNEVVGAGRRGRGRACASWITPATPRWTRAARSR